MELDRSDSGEQYDNTSSNASKTNNRRNCKVDGCNRVVKAQGLCQRHGARTKLCRSEGCQRQAQGGADGYCSK